jgi:hypothetical protein
MMRMRARALATSLVLFACGRNRAPPAIAGPEITPATAATPAIPFPTAEADAGVIRGGGSVQVGEILSPPQFDPKPTIDSLKPDLVGCYDRARATNVALRGRLRLRVKVNEAGGVVVVSVDPGGTAEDPVLVACVAGVFKAAVFPRPGGTATIVAPLVFRPKDVSR